jgi:hypothetical protein
MSELHVDEKDELPAEKRSKVQADDNDDDPDMETLIKR